MLPLGELQVDTHVLGIEPSAAGRILHVKHMAGLLIRELLLRGDLERCLVVAPGSLVEQWQTELSEKFGLRFDLLTNALVESTAHGNPFVEHDLLIARLDQLARRPDWQDKLQAEGARWDLVIIDEAHKLSAHYDRNELKTTQRYDLGKLIGHPERTRNFLLMTAKPHNGDEEDFQAWLAHLEGKKKGMLGFAPSIVQRRVYNGLVTSWPAIVEESHKVGHTGTQIDLLRGTCCT